MDDTIELAEKAFRQHLLDKYGSDDSELAPDLSLETSAEEASIVDEYDGDTLILVRGPRALGALRAALMWMVEHG